MGRERRGLPRPTRRTLWRFRLALAGALAAAWWRRQGIDSAALVEIVYRTYLGREPDPGGRQHYKELLSQGEIGLRGLVTDIERSEEFQVLGWLRLNRTPPDRLHAARLTLIREHLPPANRIIDLGGMSHQGPEGALLIMGYPHAPEEIIIVDLPADKRHADWTPDDPESATFGTTNVCYLYRSMSDLGGIADGTIDLVFSGESIEHVTPAEAEATVREAHRVLRAGGRFCLDTPNRALTRLLSPDALTHDEHQKEYYLEEITGLLKENGFEIEKTLAICPMPLSVARGVFLWQEMVTGPDIGPNAADGYLFYVQGRKPDDAGGGEQETVSS